jgi:hypothetical protein
MLIDVHGHIGRIVKDKNEYIDVKNLICKMDAWGIDITCVLPLSETPEGAYLNCNTYDVIKACKKYPKRLIPFCLIDPRFGNSKDADLIYLLAEYKEMGCKGVGELLPKMYFDDPLCMNLYKQAGKLKMPVLFDMTSTESGYGLKDTYGLPRLEHALKDNPDTVFIGHGPTFWAEISSAVSDDMRNGYPEGAIEPDGAVPVLLRKYPNLWADMSAKSGWNALARDPVYTIEFLDEFQDKIMFGTDSCRKSDVNKEYRNVTLIKHLGENNKLSKEALDKIQYQNCVRLLNLSI